MPETTITIDRDQRDGLYELVRNHLGSIEDFWIALERTRDFAKAEQLGLEFSEDFRLLQDIGWDERDERETFDLTMPTHDLMELLKRLLGEAVKILVGSGSSEAQSRRDDADTDRRFQLGYETCETVLAELAVDGVCEGHGLGRHPSGRVPCMIAGRRSRTVRRDLSTGTLVDVEMAQIGGPPVSPEELLERYGPGLPSDYRPREKGVFGIAEFFHVSGRRFIVVDGYLETVAWILKGGHPLRQVAMRPEDQREKYLAIASLAEEVDRLGANELVFTTEAWEALAVGPDDERAEYVPASARTAPS
jgi:hypothetical protein